MSEKDFWKEIRNNVGSMGQWDRIESHATSNGFPDTVFTRLGKAAFIELKFSINETPEIRPSQVRWFRKNATYGGNSFLFTKILLGKELTPFYLLFKGYKVQTIYKLPELSEWIEMADKVWDTKMDWGDFIARCTCQ